MTFDILKLYATVLDTSSCCCFLFIIIYSPSLYLLYNSNNCCYIWTSFPASTWSQVFTNQTHTSSYTYTLSLQQQVSAVWSASWFLLWALCQRHDTSVKDINWFPMIPRGTGYLPNHLTLMTWLDTLNDSTEVASEDVLQQPLMCSLYTVSCFQHITSAK